jgi:hypothetical protein
MQPTSPTIQARQLVYDTIAEMNLPDPGLCCEMVVIRDGYCVGRRFAFDTLEAVWLEAEGMIEFYDPQGELLRTVATREEVELRRAA